MTRLGFEATRSKCEEQFASSFLVRLFAGRRGERKCKHQQRDTNNFRVRCSLFGPNEFNEKVQDFVYWIFTFEMNCWVGENLSFALNITSPQLADGQLGQCLFYSDADDVIIAWFSMEFRLAQITWGQSGLGQWPLILSQIDRWFEVISDLQWTVSVTIEVSVSQWIRSVTNLDGDHLSLIARWSLNWDSFGMFRCDHRSYNRISIGTVINSLSGLGHSFWDILFGAINFGTINFRTINFGTSFVPNDEYQLGSLIWSDQMWSKRSLCRSNLMEVNRSDHSQTDSHEVQPNKGHHQKPFNSNC